MIRNLTLRGQLPLYRVRQCNTLSIQDEEIGVDCGVTQNIVFVPHIVIIPSDNHLPGSPSQAHLVLAKLRQCLFQCARGESQQRQECSDDACAANQVTNFVDNLRPRIPNIRSPCTALQS